MLAAFFCFNAFRRQELWLGLGLLLASGALGLGALRLAAVPTVLVAMGTIGLPILGLSALLHSHELPRKPMLELGAIGLLSALGGAVAVVGGAAAERAAMVALISGSWLVLGLWTLRDQFATFLPNCTRWSGGPLAGGLAVGVTAAAGVIAIQGAPLPR